MTDISYQCRLWGFDFIVDVLFDLFSISECYREGKKTKQKNLSIIIWICDGLSFEGIQAYKRPKPEAEYGSLLRSTTLLKFVSCNRNIAYVCAAVLNVGKNIISVCRTANTSDGYLWLCNSASCCHRSHWHDRKHLGNAGT